MLYNELPIAFPWYDKIEKQNRYIETSEVTCDYRLISPADALLPFEFYNNAVGGVMPTRWEVFEINTNTLIADISADISLLYRTVKEGREYFCYHGEALAGLAMPVGYFYSRLTFPGGVQAFSEMFFVPDNFFYKANDAIIDYIKLSWYNHGDIRPIFYNNLDLSGNPKFRNVLYLDTFIHASDPELTEDGEKDGNDELIQLFRKVIIQYHITIVVPDFVKKALFVMPLHDTIEMVTKNGVRSGTIENIKINSALEANGALSTVDLIFTTDVAIVKKGCAVNMV